MLLPCTCEMETVDDGKGELGNGVAFASDVPDIPEPERPDTSRMSEKEYYQAWQSYSNEIQEWYKKSMH